MGEALGVSCLGAAADSARARRPPPQTPEGMLDYDMPAIC